MATRAATRDYGTTEDRFHFKLVAAMALVLVAGFSFHLAKGRSTFDAPLVWHLHAVVFFGWTALVVAQTWLATRGSLGLHRRLGWVAAFWLPMMVVLGVAVTVATIRRGTTAFFFVPQHFLVVNILALLAVAALVTMAVRFRRSNDWHRRLQIVAFAGLLGPGFGRLLPMPLLVPVAFETAVAFGLLFPAYAMLREKRREGRVHRAWWTGVATILGALLVGEAIAFSPIGAALYAAVTAGSPGAALPGLAFGAPPPPGM